MISRFFTALLFALLFFGPAHAQDTGGGTAPPNLYAAPGNGEATRFTSIAGRTLSSATITASSFVYIVVGQSLGGSHVQGNYVGTKDCRTVNFTGDRKVYKNSTGGTELGSTFSPNGYQGWPVYSSMWAKLCDLLITGTPTASGRVIDSVLSINPSSAGQPISQFMPGGPLGYLLPLAFFTLNELGIPPSRVDAIIFMEGESDSINGTSQAAYQASMQTWFTIARNMGFVGKFIVPLETYGYGCTSTTIRAAQTAVVNGTDVIQGPDFDTFINNTCGGLAFRYAEVAPGVCFGGVPGSALIHPSDAGQNSMMPALKTTIYAHF